MNKLTYAALIGAVAAEDFIGVDKCQVANSTRLPDREFLRQMAQGTWQSVVKGAYHSQVDLISNECMGDWMIPVQDKIFETILKFEEDPRNVTIDEAYGIAHNFIDIMFKNRDTCQIGKVYDDYKTWCVNNLDQCVGSDNGFLERIYAHGPDLFSAFYDLAGVFIGNKFEDCHTDAEYINDHNRIVSDVSSIGSAIMGFEADYSVKNKHISEKDFQNQIQDYFTDMYANMTLNYESMYAGSQEMSSNAQPLDLFSGFDFNLPNLFEKEEKPHGHHGHHGKHGHHGHHQKEQQGWEMPEFLDIFKMPEMEMPEGLEMDIPAMQEMQMPEMPEMPEFPQFDFQQFKLW